MRHVQVPLERAGIDATVASANELMAAQGSVVRRAGARRRFSRTRCCSKTSARCWASRRRGFFTSARTRAKDAAGKTAEVMVFKNDNAAPSLRERLRMSDAGTLPQFNPQRRMLVLDAMDRLGAPTVPEIDTRLFGSVSIDTQACSSCNMCTVFCPTGALRKSELVPAGGGGQLPGVLGGRLRAVQPVRRRVLEELPDGELDGVHRGAVRLRTAADPSAEPARAARNIVELEAIAVGRAHHRPKDTEFGSEACFRADDSPLACSLRVFRLDFSTVSFFCTKVTV